MRTEIARSLSEFLVIVEDIHRVWLDLSRR